MGYLHNALRQRVLLILDAEAPCLRHKGVVTGMWGGGHLMLALKGCDATRGKEEVFTIW